MLLKELQSLGLAVELSTESNEIATPAAFVEGLDDDAGIDDFSDILGDDAAEGSQDEPKAPDDQTVDIPI